MAPLEVINAGMSRTGTLSLYNALNILGYNTVHFKCFHHDESLDKERFKDAIENHEEADWDKLYENYNAAVDVPTWFWYKDLIKKYPNVKVILTVRDPESWYSSLQNLISIRNDPKNQMDLQQRHEGMQLLYSFTRHPTSPLYGNLEDRESGMAAFMKHNQEVIDFVPKENLLVMELGEGWERLCHFLDKPIPDVPYPNRNNPKDLQESITQRIQDFNSSVKSLDVVENN